MSSEKKNMSKLVSHYDKLSSRYAALYDKDARTAKFYRRRSHIIAKILDQLKCESVLEVGCAVGLLAEEFSRRGVKYHGVDISPGMIEQATQNYLHQDSVSFAVDDICALSLPNATYDIVVTLGALEYCDDEEAAFLELARVLRTNGSLLISGITRNSVFNLVNRKIIRRLSGWRPACIVNEFHNEADYRALAQSAGLTNPQFYYFDFYPFHSKFEKVYRKMNWIGPVAGNGFIMTAQKGRL